MKNTIKSFTIKGLFGKLDIEIPFNDNVKVFIGDNGLGKTHVLNILYYTLTRNFEKLFSYHFDEVTVLFKNRQKVTIQNKGHDEIFDNRLYKDIIEIIGIGGLHRLRNEIAHDIPSRVLDRHPLYRKLNRLLPSHILYNELKKLPVANIDTKLITKIGNLTEDYSLLYLPTFRRVEEDIKNLGYNENFDDDNFFELSRDDNRLIHFGMTDVQKRFDNYTRKIDRLSKIGFSRISGEILSQLVKGFPKIDKNFLDEINHKDIEIILSRVGNQITKADKKRITEILKTKEIKEKDHSLLYFLQKLIDIYDGQRLFDSTIRTFVKICNKYLIDKEVIYDESAIDIYIRKQAHKKNDRLELSNLSSGEKQIISIFSKIYLTSDNQNYIILIDEPELSLSVFWQEMLLPDIVNSGKCSLLVAATHSPFIYEDNSIEQYAINLQEYITIKQNN